MQSESVQVLKDHAIPYKHIGQRGSERIVVRGDEHSIAELRRLGFRLGHGAGAIRYLMYYQGQFCGVVM